MGRSTAADRYIVFDPRKGCACDLYYADMSLRRQVTPIHSLTSGVVAHYLVPRANKSISASVTNASPRPTSRGKSWLPSTTVMFAKNVCDRFHKLENLPRAVSSSKNASYACYVLIRIHGKIHI